MFMSIRTNKLLYTREFRFQKLYKKTLEKNT